MKRSLVLMAVLAAALTFVGCKTESDDDSPKHDFKGPELPATNGDNEFVGKKIVYGQEEYFKFVDGNILEFYQIGRKQEDGYQLSKEYKYSYDSETKKLAYVLYKFKMTNEITGEEELYTYDGAYNLCSSVYNLKTFKNQFISMIDRMSEKDKEKEFAKYGYEYKGTETVEDLFDIYMRNILPKMGYTGDISSVSLEEAIKYVLQIGIQEIDYMFSGKYVYTYEYIDDNNLKLTQYFDENDSVKSLYYTDSLENFEDTSSDVSLSNSSIYIGSDKYKFVDFTDNTLTVIEAKPPVGEEPKTYVINYTYDFSQETKSITLVCEELNLDVILEKIFDPVVYKVEDIQ